SATETSSVGDISFSEGASGSTSGLLSLSQTAVGGGSSGGDATSVLEQTNPGNGGISVSSTAMGGLSVGAGNAQNTSEASSLENNVSVTANGSAVGGGNADYESSTNGGNATSSSTA